MLKSQPVKCQKQQNISCANCDKCFNFYGRAMRKKYFISEANRIKILNFAKIYVDSPQEFWNQITLSDKLKFIIFGGNGPRYM